MCRYSALVVPHAKPPAPYAAGRTGAWLPSMAPTRYAKRSHPLARRGATAAAGFISLLTEPVPPPISMLFRLPWLLLWHQDRRDIVYRRLQAAMGLTQTHGAALLGRGYSESEIDARGYRSLLIRGRASLAKACRDSDPQALDGVPGFFVTDSAQDSPNSKREHRLTFDK